MKKNIIILTLTLFHINISAQNYFQQEVNYNISVELNDETHHLIGEEIIDYTNNSPDDLDILWFHIWPNAYKDNTTALAKQKLSNGDLTLQNAIPEERGYIADLNFTIDGEKIDWQYHAEHIDICKLILNKPIKAGESVRIKTPFKVKIPHAKFSRLGHIGQSYMITQWYPKPAVYDKDGWHEMPYLDLGEFYSEFGSFDVTITLPKNYTVGATGDLQNQSELERLEEIVNQTESIFKSKKGKDMSFPESEKETKTLRYTQDKVHDFGWFADKRYHVLKGEVELPYSKRKVKLYTMFTDNEAHLWENSIEYMHDAVYYYSLWNGDYPYNYCTAVDGTISAGGGMEYPNVTVIGESGNAYYLEEVIMHEVGHNWFYGILGNNERDYAWMDEGLNSFDELRYMRKKYPEYNMLLDQLPKKIINILDLKDYTNKQIVGELTYMLNAWTAKDQPIELTSADYTPTNYFGIVYMKSAIVFDYLMSYLGEDVFDQCMQSYYEKWKFKHPQPSDLKEIFEQESGKDLSWFFDNMIKTTNQLDYSISSINQDAKILHVTLKNNGKIPGPVVICGVKDGVPNDELWIEGFEGKKTVAYINGDYDHIRIDYNSVMPETNRNNNIYKTKGLFKQYEPLKLQILGSLYHPEKTQIFFLPSIGWNKYNQLSLGISLYDKFLPKRGLSYKISPMYSFRSKDFVGKGNIAFDHYSNHNILHHSKINVEVERYLYETNKSYNRFESSLNLTLRKSSLRSKKDNYINASFILLLKKPGELPYPEKNHLEFAKLGYTFSNARTINPYSTHLQLEGSIDFLKLNMIVNSTMQHNKNIINIRGYFGGMGYLNNDDYRKENPYHLQMSAWNGSNDYSFSERSIARSDSSGMYSKQIFIKEGGLKHVTSIESSSFISSIHANYILDLPIRIGLYAEAGAGETEKSGIQFAYGAGFELIISKGMHLYIPIYTENGLFNDQKFKNSMRMVLNMQLNLSNVLSF